MAKTSPRGAVAKRARSQDPAVRSAAGEASPPGFIAPAIATSADKVPAGSEWLHEFKWDGYRLMVRVDRGEVQLFTRNGYDWTDRFPAIAKAAAALPVTSAYLDGEAVVEERGIPDFTALRRALGAGRGDKAILIAFDLLFLDGQDLRKEPLTVPKERLARYLRDVPRPSALVYSEHVAGMGDFMMRQAGALGLEGVLSKRGDRGYTSGDTRDWRKVKRINRQEFVVAGYLMPEGETAGDQLAGAGWYEHGRLIYRGRVGVGFDQRTARELWWKLQPLRQKDPAFAAGIPSGGARDAVWVEPKLVAEVAFGHWTPGGLLRHAVFKGLREDKAPEEVVGMPAEAEDPAPQPEPEAPPGSRSKEAKPKPKPKAVTTRAAARDAKVGVPRENILQLLP
jgi:bifunctional non-homologous end joining protein LigD